jgi:MFS family permease
MGILLLTLIYICFISLGLPDSLLGSMWPVVHTEISAPVSLVGTISMLTCVGTIISSLFSDKLLHRFGAGKVTAASVAMTAVAMFGFSMSSQLWMFWLWAIPYGLGAGGVDAILNNYVALHYKAQHMSWLHCMWGVGASISPYIMSLALVRFDHWSYGCLIIAILQIVLSTGIFISIPLWKKGMAEDNEEAQTGSVPFKEIFTAKGAIPCFIAFFAYCSLELTASLWASSYLVQKWALTPEAAAGFASLFYIGVTCGRFANGFLAMRLSDRFLIRMGFGIMAAGVALLFVPLHSTFALIGFVVIGLGCAPIDPCLIHMTPAVFGEDKSQAMIGVQTAFSYMGYLTMPTLFGLFAEYVSVSLLPVFLLALLLLMTVMHELVAKKDSL